MLTENGIQVFAYLDTESVPTAWALVRGVLVSADCVAPNTPEANAFVSFMLAGMLQCEAKTRFYNESLIEEIRAKEFPEQISRLRGLYFFPTLDEAMAPIRQDWPGHFREHNLLELRLYPSRPITRADANWITYAKRDDGRIDAHNLEWVRAYWRGETCPCGQAPVWELIAAGEAVVLDIGVRRRCYDRLRQQFPDSWVPIEMSHVAGEVGTRGGLIAPFIRRIDDEQAELGYVWRDAEFHDLAVIEAMKRHPGAGYLGQLLRETPEWKMPDLRSHFRRFRLDAQGRPLLNEFAWTPQNA